MAIHQEFQTHATSLIGRCPSYNHLEQEEQEDDLPVPPDQHDYADSEAIVAPLNEEGFFYNYDGTLTIDLDALEQDEGNDDDDDAEYDAAMDQVASMLNLAVALCDDIDGPLLLDDDDDDEDAMFLDEHYHQTVYHHAVQQTTSNGGVPSSFPSNANGQEPQAADYDFFMSRRQ